MPSVAIPHYPPILTIVQFAGAVGALFSTLIRLYSLEDLPKAIVARELEGLSSSYLLIYSLVPAVFGFVSATAIHMLFASGLLEGGLFPKFICKLSEGKCLDFGTLITEFGPADAREYAKAIVWGFIAGFAERLVPDTLRSLSKSGQQRDIGNPSGGPASETHRLNEPLSSDGLYYGSMLRIVRPVQPMTAVCQNHHIVAVAAGLFP
jgi:hypothetical protein